MILNASPANGASSSGGRPSVSPVFLMALDRRDVDGGWQIIDHRVEHRLHALVLERGAAQHGEDLAVYGAGAQALLDVVDRELALAEELVHEFLPRLGGGLH